VILVVGATGRVGRRVVEELVAGQTSVRAIVREPSRAALPAEVDLAAGDLTDAETVARAVKGCTAVFLVWPTGDPLHAEQAVRAAADGARRIVYLSTVGVRDELERQAHPLSAMHAEVEQHVRSSAAEWTILRATKFAANTLAWAPTVRSEGVVEGTFGHQHRSPIDERDIASVATRALLDDDHSGSTYVISGPASLTEREQATIVGRAIGRRIRWREIEPAEARRRMIAGGASDELADAALAYWAAFVERPEPVTDSVELISGHPARSFEEWAADNAEQFR